jgi:hypothetical protein
MPEIRKHMTVTTGNKFVMALIQAGVIPNEATHIIIECRVAEPVEIICRSFATAETLESALVMEAVAGLKVEEEKK